VSLRTLGQEVLKSFSGVHPHLAKHKPVFEQIAEVLLFPGVDLDEDKYARYVAVQSRVHAILGFRGTARILREVMNTGSKKVAAAACFSLYSLHPFGDPCLTRLLEDGGTDEVMRQESRQKLAQSTKSANLDYFKSRPVDWLNSWVENEKGLAYVALTYKEDAQFLLSELVRSDDPVVQRNARMLLRDYMPKL
jgi:hypothetical protein